jgi:hypothetical protein
VTSLKTSRKSDRVLVYNKLTSYYEIYNCKYMLVLHIVDFDAR